MIKPLGYLFLGISLTNAPLLASESKEKIQLKDNAASISYEFDLDDLLDFEIPDSAPSEEKADAKPANPKAADETMGDNIADPTDKELEALPESESTSILIGSEAKSTGGEDTRVTTGDNIADWTDDWLDEQLFGSITIESTPTIEEVEPKGKVSKEAEPTSTQKTSDALTFPQCYFSPNSIEQVLIKFISQEKGGINAACFEFTLFSIAQAWALRKQALQRLEGELIVDKGYQKKITAALLLLADNGIPLSYAYADANLNKNEYSNMHHKFFIFQNNVNGKKLLLTGSYNCTGQAEKNNWENIVILDDIPLINKFLDEWKKLSSIKKEITKADLFAYQGEKKRSPYTLQINKVPLDYEHARLYLEGPALSPPPKPSQAEPTGRLFTQAVTGITGPASEDRNYQSSQKERKPTLPSNSEAKRTFTSNSRPITANPPIRLAANAFAGAGLLRQEVKTCPHCGGNLKIKNNPDGSKYYACAQWRKDRTGCRGYTERIY